MQMHIPAMSASPLLARPPAAAAAAAPRRGGAVASSAALRGAAAAASHPRRTAAASPDAAALPASKPLASPLTHVRRRLRGPRAPGASPPAAAGGAPSSPVEPLSRFDLPLAVALAGAAFEAYLEPLGAVEGLQEASASGTRTTYTDRRAAPAAAAAAAACCPAAAWCLRTIRSRRPYP